MQLALANNQIKRGENVSFNAILTATGALKGKSVNFEIIAVEHVKFVVDVTDGTNSVNSVSTLNTHQEQRSKDNTTYENKQVLAQGDFQMNQGETKQFSGTMQVPTTGLATYTGIDATHTWKLRIWVDVPMGGDIEASSEFTVS